MMTVCPHTSPSFWPKTRAIRSELPPGRLPLAPDHGAVDDHRVDAFRAMNGLREARRLVDFIFIEHDDIRGETLLQDAPVRKPEGPRREAGHLVHRGLQREQVQASGVMSQHPRKRSPQPRMR